MSKSSLVTAVIGLAIVVAVPVASYIHAYNTGNQFEQGLKASQESNQVVLSSYSQKVLEASQVTGIMRDDIVKVTKQAIEGRYGPDGARAAFQMITEQNPQVSPELYVKLQQIIDAGRTEYENAQKRLIDQKRAYSTALNSFYMGFWMTKAGYPKINLDDYKAITTTSVDETYKAGKEAEPIQLRPAQ